MLELWRGYVAHALLFYRQNNLKSLSDLPRLGAGLEVGPCPEPPPGLERGLRLPERYWGSLRLGPRALAVFDESDTQWGHLLAGMTLEMQRRYTPAIARLSKAIDGRWAWPHILTGVCRWYQADFRGSIDEFSRAADLMPDPTLALLFRARAKADLRDRTLVSDLDKALKLSPDCGFTLSWRGRALYVVQRTPEALKDLERSIELLPDYDRGYSWLGVSHAERGRHDLAVPLLERARKLNPYYPTTLYPLARGLMAQGKLARAGKILEEAAAIDRHGVWSEHRISMSHPNSAALRSLRDLDAFLEKKPGTPWARAWRGQTRLLLQQYWQALPDLQGKGAWSRLWRAETWRRLGYARRALPLFKKGPKVAFKHAGEGACLLDLGRPAQALAPLTRALALNDRCGPAWAWRGRARFMLGRWREAAADLEKAIELHPQDSWTRDLLWQARALAGDKKGALSALGDAGFSDRLWAARGWLSGDESARRRALELNPAQPLALRGARNAREAVALCAPSDPAAHFAPARLEEEARRLLPPRAYKAWQGARFHEALAALPPGRDVQSLLFRGTVCLQAGLAPEAVEAASQALDATLDPLCAPALWLRVLSKMALGESAEAAEDEARLTALRGAAAGPRR